MRPCLKTKIMAILCLVAALNLNCFEVLAEDSLHSTTQSTEQDTDLLRGKWKGSWVSCKSGHTGRLNATFCRINNTQVEAKFTGTFAKFLPFRYKATLNIVNESDGVIQLKGSRKLGPLMGTFTYKAMLSADEFSATYQSKRDTGQWKMNRITHTGS